MVEYMVFVRDKSCQNRPCESGVSWSRDRIY